MPFGMRRVGRPLQRWPVDSLLSERPPKGYCTAVAPDPSLLHGGRRQPLAGQGGALMARLPRSRRSSAVRRGCSRLGILPPILCAGVGHRRCQGAVRKCRLQRKGPLTKAKEKVTSSYDGREQL